jgi:hypothetical protein
MIVTSSQDNEFMFFHSDNFDTFPTQVLPCSTKRDLVKGTTIAGNGVKEQSATLTASTGIIPLRTTLSYDINTTE